jgi:hypothetical protein
VAVKCCWSLQQQAVVQIERKQKSVPQEPNIIKPPPHQSTTTTQSLTIIGSRTEEALDNPQPNKRPS